MKSLTLLAASLACFALAGCASEHKTTASSAPVNSKCPISGKPVDNTKTVSYKDKTVGFCCGGCPEKWAKLSDSEKDAKLAACK